MYIGGQFEKPAGGEYFPSLNPADGSLVARVAKGSPADVDKAVSAATKSQSEWAAMKPLDRGRILKRVAEAINASATALAQSETDEMGMPPTMATMSISGAADFFEYYGGLATSTLGDTIPSNSDKFCYSILEPYGVVGVITPWNGPLNQAARSVAPALAVGNSVVLKPSEFASLSSVEFARLAHEAGLPAGVLNVVTGFGEEVGQPLTAHPGVRKVAFTGSVATGRAVGRTAAEKVMPVTLELGGKSPNIVFDDANLDAALPMVLFGFVANSGQICASGTRVLIQRSIYDQFSTRVAAAAEQFPIGIDKEFPTLGPMANRMQYDKVLDYLAIAREEGATVLAGGGSPDDADLNVGLYIRPTVLADVTPDMRVVREEIFGPVGVLIPFDTEQEAIQIANDTPFGLAAGVWTGSLSRAHRVASKLEAGTVYVNTYHDPATEAPAGGYKQSGIGRERGIAALREYLQLKTVSIKLI